MDRSTVSLFEDVEGEQVDGEAQGEVDNRVIPGLFPVKVHLRAKRQRFEGSTSFCVRACGTRMSDTKVKMRTDAWSRPAMIDVVTGDSRLGSGIRDQSALLRLSLTCNSRCPDAVGLDIDRSYSHRWISVLPWTISLLFRRRPFCFPSSVMVSLPDPFDSPFASPVAKTQTNKRRPG